jgi:hypothetical protein
MEDTPTKPKKNEEIILSREEKITAAVNQAKKLGNLGCSLCPAITGVYRINLHKLMVKDKQGKLKNLRRT